MLKEKITSHLRSAISLKASANERNALSGLISDITYAEKQPGATQLTDQDVLKIVYSRIKKANQSIEQFRKGNREDLVQKELEEIQVFEKYLPAKMTDEEIQKESSVILTRLSSEVKDKKALIGRSMGEFSKKYTGRADMSSVQRALEKAYQELFENIS